jgi:hypothetical protein
MLHRILDRAARKYCPVVKDFAPCHWSLMQAEYATDVVFRRQEDLKHLYEDLSRTAIHSVKPEQVATFLGRKPHGGYQDQIGKRNHAKCSSPSQSFMLGGSRYDWSRLHSVSLWAILSSSSRQPRSIMPGLVTPLFPRPHL